MLRRDRYGEEAALAEASGSPAVLARVSRLRELMVEGAAEVLAQERAYREARERFEQADRRCARALGALLDDVLADTWQYDTVKGRVRSVMVSLTRPAWWGSSRSARRCLALWARRRPAWRWVRTSR